MTDTLAGTLVPRRRLALLRRLQGRRALQEVVGHWPNVKRFPGWNDTRQNRARVARQWSQLSGVSDFVIKREWRYLFGNGITLEDGSVDPVADFLILHEMLVDAPEAMRVEILQQMEVARSRAAAQAEADKQRRNDAGGS